MDTGAAFDLTSTYVLLLDGGRAPTIGVTESFWRDLMSGSPASPGAELLANGGGWLAAVYRTERDTPSWEMHPAGDELLVLLSGAIGVVIEGAEGNRNVELRAGKSRLVPRGTWHKQVVRTPGEELALTYGKGTQHRPA